MSAQVLATTIGMERETWLELRRQGIGGSDAAAIAGLNPFKSPVQVWLEKTGQELPEEEPSEFAYWGNVLESVVADEFAKREGKRVHRRNAILQHPEHTFMLANLDRVIVADDEGMGILECKTTSAWNTKAWDGDKIPDMHAIQMQHYLAVTGYSYGYIAALIGGNKYVCKRIERDEEAIAALIQIESDFWDMVTDKTPPAMDGSEACTELLKTLYPEGRPEEIVLPETAQDLIDAYEAAAAREKAAGIEKDEAGNTLKALLGEYEVGRVGEHLVTWKTITQNRLDSKGLEKSEPDIYGRYVKTSTYRKFNITGGKY